MERLLVALALTAVLAGCAQSTSGSSDPAPTSRSCPTVTGAQAKYLCWLQTYSFNVTPDTQQSLLVAGDTLCQGLRKGGTPEQGIAVLFRTVPDISQQQAGNLITAAQMGLCPDTLGQ